jgi:hypothetical protein
MPEINDVCILTNIFCLKKPDVLVFLAKPDVPICQIGVFGFDRQNIYFYFL